MLSWYCLDAPYIAQKYTGAGKITGNNRQCKQRQTDIQEARMCQEASSGEGRGEAELLAGVRWNRKAWSERKQCEGARRETLEAAKISKEWDLHGHRNVEVGRVIQEQLRPATAGSPRPCPAWFWIAPWTETHPQPPSWQKSFLMFRLSFLWSCMLWGPSLGLLLLLTQKLITVIAECRPQMNTRQVHCYSGSKAWKLLRGGGRTKGWKHLSPEGVVSRNVWSGKRKDG